MVSAVGQMRAQTSESFNLTLQQRRFVPGDTVFFKAYFFDAGNKPVQGKNLANIDLVNSSGKPVVSTCFNVLAGIGKNQIVLPDTLKEGFYNLVGMINSLQYGAIKWQREIFVVKDKTIISQRHSMLTGTALDGNIDRISAVLKISTTVYARRQKVEVDISLQGKNDEPVRGEFSVNVFNGLLTNTPSDFGMNEEVSGNEWLRHLDELMRSELTSYTHTEHIPSIFQRTGKVFYAGTSKPVADNTQVLFYLQKSQWYNQTFTLNQGSIRLNLPQFTGMDELFYLAESDRGKTIKVDVRWDEPVQPEFSAARSFAVSEMDDAYARFSKNKKLIESSYNAFTIDNVNERGDSDEEFDLVEPDNVIPASKYITFQSMEEMILEVVPGVFHRKNGNDHIVRITLPDPMNVSGDPIYIINGRATTSTNLFLSIPPSDLEFIAIVKEPKKLLPLKLLGKNGIMIAKTKHEIIDTTAADPARQVVGLNPELTFRSSLSSPASANETPDFRSTLYWNPSMQTDANGKAKIQFYTSDDVGTMTLHVEGYTATGEAFSESIQFEVR